MKYKKIAEFLIRAYDGRIFSTIAFGILIMNRVLPDKLSDIQYNIYTIISVTILIFFIFSKDIGELYLENNKESKKKILFRVLKKFILVVISSIAVVYIYGLILDGWLF